ncbi:hypothetical protein C8Q74DRAFT_1053625 [Fomes fomentarius]|nr:hypothetical protein C8Q74DRAFT_1053625 [Fomes fomentarius]
MPLLPVIVATPLLKVPILLGYATCAYSGMTPTAAPPLPKGRQTPGPDFLRWAPGIQKAATATAKTVVCSLAIAEAAILIAQELPPSSTVHRVTYDLLSHLRLDISTLKLSLTCSSAVGCLLGIAGGVVRMACHRTLGRFFTWEMGLREDHQLVTNGPYSVVRHPSYTGWLLLVIGHFVFLSSEGSLFKEAGMWRSGLGKVVACGVLGHLTWVTGGYSSGRRRRMQC